MVLQDGVHSRPAPTTYFPIYRVPWNQINPWLHNPGYGRWAVINLKHDTVRYNMIQHTIHIAKHCTYTCLITLNSLNSWRPLCKIFLVYKRHLHEIHWCRATLNNQTLCMSSWKKKWPEKVANCVCNQDKTIYVDNSCLFAFTPEASVSWGANSCTDFYSPLKQRQTPSLSRWWSYWKRRK